MVRASKCGTNSMLAYDPWSPAVSQCLLMAAKCFGPRDAVMAPTDLPAPPWLFGVSPMSP